MPSARLGIPAVDRLVHIFENAASHTYAHSDRRSYPYRPAHITTLQKQIGKGTVIEITSPGPGAGKTHLLYYLTAVAVLPEKHDGIALNGRRGSVVVLDTDGRFDVPRLVQVMEHYIRLRKGARSDDNSNTNADSSRELIYSALHHIHIFRSQSLQSLIATVSTLPSYLLDAKAHYSSNRPLVALLFDSASAFFWQAKAGEDASRYKDSNDQGETAASVADNYIRLVHHLRTIQNTFECAIVATTWGLTPTSGNHPNTNAPSSFRPHLPPVWTAFTTLRLTVDRDAVANFAPGMSAEEAVRDKEARQDAVRKGRFSAWVDGWGSDGWSDGIREALSEEGNAGFGFVISNDGIEMSE